MAPDRASNRQTKSSLSCPFISMIHSVDSERLLKTINKEAVKVNRVIDVLIQLHIARESTKFGFSCEEAEALINSPLLTELNNVRIRGVMGMATFTDDVDLVRREFRTLNGYFNRLKDRFFQNDDNFNEKSMGMSDDYPIAIEEGSTMIRVGSLIFGER